MTRKVIVSEYESLRDAIREWRKLVFEFGVQTGPGFKDRADNRRFYVSYEDRKRQRFYYEKPSAKKRRKRHRRIRGSRGHQHRMAYEKGRHWQRLR